MTEENPNFTAEGGQSVNIMMLGDILRLHKVYFAVRQRKHSVLHVCFLVCLIAKSYLLYLQVQYVLLLNI